MQSFYVCPKTKKSLRTQDNGLLRDDGILYPFIQEDNNKNIPNFVITQKSDEASKVAQDTYNREDSALFYRNFMDWLFQTFDEDELDFRANLVSKLKLKMGSKVLITGCGLGDDILPIIDQVGSQGAVYASDLAAEMIINASYRYSKKKLDLKNVFFSICDAQNLPFVDNSFDGAFHFGGINLFNDMKQAIEEMERVVKPGGRVVFGDEGIAPWLKSTEYGQIAIKNNPIWASNAPIDLLPEDCIDVNLSWILGNCFYLIDFEVSEDGPYMDIDVQHKGRRGGSMRSRYYGQLEGVTEANKKFVLEDAKNKGISVHDWLEQVINERKREQT